MIDRSCKPLERLQEKNIPDEDEDDNDDVILLDALASLDFKLSLSQSVSH